MRYPATLLTAVLFLTRGTAAADDESQPWEQYIYSPATRNIPPLRIHEIVGDAKVRNCSTGSNGQVINIKAGSRVSVDFGVEVGGHVSFNVDAYGASSSSPLSLAFSESPLFVGEISDDTGAAFTMDWDQAFVITLPDETEEGGGGPVWYRTPKERFRGGFRFLTFNALEDVTVFNITSDIEFAPNMPDLRSGTGYFYTPDDEALNRIWYAGAYTIQTNIVPADTGRWLPQVRPGWAYNNTLSVATPALVDGAKRDRAIWPGDLGIQAPIAMLAYGVPGRESVFNSLETLFYYQNVTDGMFPFAGPATGSFRNGAKSDTYHTWALIGMYDYAVWSGDEGWLQTYWGHITKGVEHVLRNVDGATGLQRQVWGNDWARMNTGGLNSALNALNYHALVSLARLAKEEAQALEWKAAAEKLREGYNAVLWDEEAGLYRDNTESDLHAQDGNALALLYGLAPTVERRKTISVGLERNWNEFGPVTPELNDTISPFISGLELLAHLHGAEEPERGMKLLRRLWGYILPDTAGHGITENAAQAGAPLFTGSTLVEGLSANGSLYYRGERGYRNDAAYTSHAHGWSAGPTTALVSGILGFRIDNGGSSTTSGVLGGKEWVLKPQLGGLRDVRAGFETGLGWFAARVQDLGEEGWDIEIEVPRGTKGKIILPPLRVGGREGRRRVVRGAGRRVRVNGEDVDVEVEVGEESVLLFEGGRVLS